MRWSAILILGHEGREYLPWGISPAVMFRNGDGFTRVGVIPTPSVIAGIKVVWRLSISGVRNIVGDLVGDMGSIIFHTLVDGRYCTKANRSAKDVGLATLTKLAAAYTDKPENIVSKSSLSLRSGWNKVTMSLIFII